MNQLLKIIKEEIENFNKSKLIGYHVTRKKNLPSIKKYGLKTNVPEDFGENGDVNGVYLFKTKDDMINALYNWLGERIEEWEEENNQEYNEIALEVDLTGLEQNLINSVEYEWISIQDISPDRIINVFNI